MTIDTRLVTGVTESGEPESASPTSPVDPSVHYPSYKSLDSFVDIAKLRSLDGYMIQKIKRHMRTQDEPKFYTGPYRLDNDAAERPGSRMIYLSYSERPDSYFDLDQTELWHPTVYTQEFALLMEFIRTLPFEATGRMLIMYDDIPRDVPAHRDHLDTETCHEFLWFRTNLKKKFYLLNHETGEKRFIDSYTAWFDTVNQYHGSDASDGLSFSVRVDGRFTPEFRNKIPKPPVNKASTASYWESFEKRNNGGRM